MGPQQCRAQTGLRLEHRRAPEAPEGGRSTSGRPDARVVGARTARLNSPVLQKGPHFEPDLQLTLDQLTVVFYTFSQNCRKLYKENSILSLSRKLNQTIYLSI